MTYYYSVIHNPLHVQEIPECSLISDFISSIRDVKPGYIKDNTYCREFLADRLSNIYGEILRISSRGSPIINTKIKTTVINFTDDNILLINKFISQIAIPYYMYKHFITATNEGLEIRRHLFDTSFISFLMYIMEEHLNDLDEDLIPIIINNTGRFEEHPEEALLTAFYYYCLKRANIGNLLYDDRVEFAGPASYIRNKIYYLINPFKRFYNEYKDVPGFMDIVEDNYSLTSLIYGVKSD